jgi:hypothetical protein
LQKEVFHHIPLCNVHINTGAIENLKINNKLVEILEGTLPVFNNRDLMYSITKENKK